MESDENPCCFESHACILEGENAHSLYAPLLNDLKAWLDKNSPKVAKNSLTRIAMTDMLNQWDKLIRYCDDGRLHISNALAENAIRPFAVGRRNWLFADTQAGANASALYYSLVETDKANAIESYACFKYVLDRIAYADTVEKMEALLPWNVPAELTKDSAKSPAYDWFNRMKDLRLLRG